MKQYAKRFAQRGLAFGGFGPIIAAVVFLILQYTVEGFSLTGGQVFTAVVSTYLLAFLQAGGSVFHQIEHWSLMKAILCHFALLYAAYVGCYLVNAWIPFAWEVILAFTGIFAGGYFVIWWIVYASVKIASRKMSRKLQA